MAHQSDPRFLVLHGLRLKGFAEPEALSPIAGMAADDVRSHLLELDGQGMVLHRDGRMSGWSLTPDGRQRHAGLIEADLEAAGCREGLDDAYRQFLKLNPRLLEACTAWQLRQQGDRQVPNDHADPDYDAGILTRLAEIDEEIRPVCAELAAMMGRYAHYSERLSTALGRVRQGETDWFTRPLIDSYHTVWFELHEDLLVTLGIERARETL
ncbi:MAG TPA: hypothetical protein VFA11_08705 [Acidimicrobiales bacterium]|nr:hypothetical protein [Acidimicrobiales bacterium]